MRKIVLLSILISVGTILCAQNNKNAVIVMKSGSIFEGEIIEWANHKYIKLMVKGFDEPITIIQNEIQKIVPNGDVEGSSMNENTSKLKSLSQYSLYNFKHKGFYASARAQIITANDGFRLNGINGIGVSISAGHRFSRLLAIGGGIGFDQYVWNSGEELIPIFAELSGFFMPELTSFFYNIQAGYSIALSDEQYFIENAKGGYNVYPSLGIRFGAGQSKMTLDVGYKFQNAIFTYFDPWQRTTKSEQNITYKRLAIRLGILLQ